MRNKVHKFHKILKARKHDKKKGTRFWCHTFQTVKTNIQNSSTITYTMGKSYTTTFHRKSPSEPRSCRSICLQPNQCWKSYMKSSRSSDWPFYYKRIISSILRQLDFKGGRSDHKKKLFMQSWLPALVASPGAITISSFHKIYRKSSTTWNGVTSYNNYKDLTAQKILLKSVIRSYLS